MNSTKYILWYNIIQSVFFKGNRNPPLMINHPTRHPLYTEYTDDDGVRN